MLLTDQTKLYFSQYFPTVQFKDVEVVDLTRRSVILSSVRNNAVMVGDYVVKDGETAWSLAYDFYSDENYYWVILHCNLITDPFFQWPLGQVELERLVACRYPDRDATHHYLLDDAWGVQRTYQTSTGDPREIPITCYQHEEIQNERRRKIKVLRPEFLGPVVEAFRKAMT